MKSESKRIKRGIINTKRRFLSILLHILGWIDRID